MLFGAGCAKGVLVLAGQVAVLRGHLPQGLGEELPILGAAAFAALWPDGDSPTSTLGRCLPGHRVYGHHGYEGRAFLGVVCWHRHRWHSLGALGIVAAEALTSALVLALGSGAEWAWGAAVGVIVGYASHLLGDLPFGRQMLGWPFSDRLIGLGDLYAWLGGRRGRRRARSVAP